MEAIANYRLINRSSARRVNVRSVERSARQTAQDGTELTIPLEPADTGVSPLVM
jgi:hypothetical protein